MSEHANTEAIDPTPGEVGLSEAEIAELAAAHRDSYPMGNIHHGTPERPDWGTFCVECKQSWPCDVSRLLSTLAREAELQHERDTLRAALTTPPTTEGSE